MSLKPYWILLLETTSYTNTNDLFVVARNPTEALAIARFVYGSRYGVFQVHNDFETVYHKIYEDFTEDAVQRGQIGYYQIESRTHTFKDVLTSPFVVYLTREDKVNLLLE